MSLIATVVFYSVAGQNGENTFTSIASSTGGKKARENI